MKNRKRFIMSVPWDGKSFRGIALLLFITSMAMGPSIAHGGFADLLKGLQQAVGLGGGPSETKIIDGLKEALQVGTKNAVEVVSKVGGYAENPQIRIPLPGAVQQVEQIIRTAGFGEQLDAFEMSMNRAAEKAAPQAKAIFSDAIKAMTISDAATILKGRENEATLYFKDKTHDPLSQVFKPIIREAMSGVGVTRKFQALNDMVRTLPFVQQFTFDLDQYVNDRALDGLFWMLAQEEKKIRQDPAARVTDLLKEVFAKQP